MVCSNHHDNNKFTIINSLTDVRGNNNRWDRRTEQQPTCLTVLLDNAGFTGVELSLGNQ